MRTFLERKICMIIYGGKSDVGYNREINEDFIHCREIDKNNNILFAVIADGAGTMSSKFQSAPLAALQIESAIERIYETDPDALFDYPSTFLTEAVISAGKTIGTFRVVDEERYAGFATSISCVLILGKRMIIAHSGNTRINLFRYIPKSEQYNCLQLTKDDTKGMELVEQGKLTFAEYHLSAERLQVTGGLGLSSVPKVQTREMELKDNDFILMTTDGIHNAIRPDVFFEIIKRSVNCEETATTLVEAAKIEKYEDNMSALLLWNKGDM